MTAVDHGRALAPAGPLAIEPTGPGALDGLRVVIKDLIDVAGHVTAAGNPTLAAGPVATQHAAVVTAVLAQGATIVAKTATDELAMGMFGVNTHYGTPANPAAPDRVPGGSSSGAASAVAAGWADLGIGTDTGGSIRVPGAFCGLVGLRPTHGRIDIGGVRPMAPTFDTIGLLARDVATVAAAFGALAAARPSRQISELVLLTDLLDRAGDEIATLTRTVAAGWADALGLQLREDVLVDERLPAELVEVFWPLMSRQLWESNGAWVAANQPVLGEGIGDRIDAAATTTDAEVAAAEAQQQALAVRLAELLGAGVAVLPTTCDAAPPLTADHAQLMEFRAANLPMVVPAALTGAPQITLPTGAITSAVIGTAAPLGTSLLGLPGDDELLLQLAATVGR